MSMGLFSSVCFLRPVFLSPYAELIQNSHLSGQQIRLRRYRLSRECYGYYKVTERVGEAFKDGLKLKK